jgi:ribosome-binding factor A
MSSQRIERVNELMRRELGPVILRLATGVDVSTITVTRVDTAPNLRTARVLVSIRGDEEARTETMRCLRHIRADMQEHIGRHLNLKYTPVLRLVEDASQQLGGHLLDVLNELKAEDGSDSSDLEDLDPRDPEASL